MGAPLGTQIRSQKGGHFSATTMVMLFRRIFDAAGIKVSILGPPGAWYQFTIDRKGEQPVRHLSDYKGWVHADGYAGFNGLFSKDKASEVACMAHIRRKFVDVQQSQGSAIAEEAIKRIAKLYGIEKKARGHTPEERVQLRQKKAKPIFDNLELWLHAQLPKISGKSPLAKAIRYPSSPIYDYVLYVK